MTQFPCAFKWFYKKHIQTEWTLWKEWIQMRIITALQEESLLALQRDLGTCKEGQSNREDHNTPRMIPPQPRPGRPSGHRITNYKRAVLNDEGQVGWAQSQATPGHFLAIQIMIYRDAWGWLLGLMLIRETGLVHRWPFCLHAILLLAPGYLAPKGIAGPAAGAWATRGAGIGDAGPDGLVTCVGRGAGVAWQPGI